MPEYLVYIKGSDGHFHSAVPLECANDVAMNLAEEVADGHDVDPRSGGAAKVGEDPVDGDDLSGAREGVPRQRMEQAKVFETKSFSSAEGASFERR
jgi:hypothetical protein